MLITDLVAYLKTQTTITDLVANRIQSIPAPVDTSQYPCITYQVASTVPEYDNDGYIGLTTSRIVFDCLAYANQSPAYLAARALAETLARALGGFAGELPGGTVVDNMEVVNIVDRWNDGSRVSCTSVHVLITHVE